MSTDKRRRLGRGLEALLSARPLPERSSTAADSQQAPSTALRQIPVSQIRSNPLQPRRTFDDAELRELQASILANGLLQPVTVRATDHGFELIAGERRFRAVQLLGWREIPAIVRGAGEISNLQRTDLNPIEEADGYQNLITQFSLTQMEIAEVVGKDRSTVANTLRLLALPAVVRQMVREGVLTIGHARALLALGDDRRMVDLAKVIATEGLSVREVERRVREAGTRHTKVRENARQVRPERSPDIVRIEDELRRRLQTDVKVMLTSRDKGELRISFYSADDLERLLDAILSTARETV
jgi:ParB family chromosome partitioning protein